MPTKNLNEIISSLRKSLGEHNNKAGLVLLEIIEMLIDRREEDGLLVKIRIEEHLRQS